MPSGRPDSNFQGQFGVGEFTPARAVLVAA